MRPLHRTVYVLKLKQVKVIEHLGRLSGGVLLILVFLFLIASSQRVGVKIFKDLIGFEYRFVKKNVFFNMGLNSVMGVINKNKSLELFEMKVGAHRISVTLL